MYSELCLPCASSEDNALAALQRQFLLAGPNACSEQPRFFVGSLGGDIKGLQQLLGTAGASATYFCMFCKGTLNGTLKAGVPHLRDLPSPWKERDEREIDVIAPPARPDSEAAIKLAEGYLAAAATAVAAGKKAPLSAQWLSQISNPIIVAADWVQVLSGVPLHCSLGTGLKLINAVEALCKGYWPWPGYSTFLGDIYLKYE